MRLILYFLMAVALAGCSVGQSLVSNPQGQNVRYEVYTNCSTNLTLRANQGGTEQYPIDPSWPWFYERSAVSRDFLYISGQVQCRGGSITTRIMRWDGLALYGNAGWYVWRQNNSTGDFVISTTSGSF